LQSNETKTNVIVEWHLIVLRENGTETRWVIWVIREGAHYAVQQRREGHSNVAACAGDYALLVDGWEDGAEEVMTHKKTIKE